VRVSLKFDGARGPAAKTALLADGKEVGFVTRSGFSPALNAWIGMGYVRREKSRVGTELAIPEGRATVVEAPVSR
jgi:glycine cleavage system aminomethyltransferase T